VGSKRKPGPKPKLKRDRQIARSIAMRPDHWRYCIAEALRLGITVSEFMRELVEDHKLRRSRIPE
jgi:hypothetical protein